LYKDTTLSIPEIASELGVSTILEGGIQRAGARIRINAQLINVSNDQHLWAETFDREMTIENIFEIQSEITRQIVTAVRGELSEEESANLGNLPTDNLEAYEAFLRALAFTNLPDYVQDNYINAEVWLTKAIELDPEYAQAWSLLVVVHGQAVWIGYDGSPERIAAAKLAAENAVKYGPGTAEALAAEGEYLYRITNDFAASVEKYQAAYSLAPGDADLLERLAVAQRRAGLFDESINNFKKGMERDPGNSRTATLLTDTLLNNKRFIEASPLIDDYIQKFPNAHDLKGQKSRVFLYGSGDIQSARAVADLMPTVLSNEYYVSMTLLPMIERDYQLVIDAFDIPEMRELSLNRGYMGDDYWLRGFAYRMLGDETAAIAEFDAAIELLTNIEPTGTQTDAFEQQFLSLSYAGKGEYEEAIRVVNNAVEMFAAGGDAIFTREAEKYRALILGMAGEREDCIHSGTSSAMIRVLLSWRRHQISMR
jgi:tetratricopeptide (TPR) repeat protein